MYGEGINDEVEIEFPEEQEEIETFYLHGDNLPAWEIFNIAKAYLSAYEELPQLIIVRLLDEKGIKLEEGLLSIALIYSSYLKLKRFFTKDKK